jgi:hypothetical protein
MTGAEVADLCRWVAETHATLERQASRDGAICRSEPIGDLFVQFDHVAPLS